MDSEKHQDLGSWTGLQNVFAAVAGSCSAARAQCLKQVRDSHMLDDLGLTGDESEKVASRRATNPVFGYAFPDAPRQLPCLQQTSRKNRKRVSGKP